MRSSAMARALFEKCRLAGYASILARSFPACRKSRNAEWRLQEQVIHSLPTPSLGTNEVGQCENDS
jgi:hypothetical protein